MKFIFCIFTGNRAGSMRTEEFAHAFGKSRRKVSFCNKEVLTCRAFMQSLYSNLCYCISLQNMLLYKFHQGVLIFSCEDTIQIGYRTLVVLRCTSLPEVMYGGALEVFLHQWMVEKSPNDFSSVNLN